MSGVLCAMGGLLASGAGGSVATGAVSGGVTSSSMAAVSVELEVMAGASGEVDLAASYSFSPATEAGQYLWARWYEWTGSAWSPIGAEVQATSPSYYTIIYAGGVAVGAQEYPGFGTCNFTRTGLTTGETRKFKLFARAASNAYGFGLSGIVSAEGN